MQQELGKNKGYEYARVSNPTRTRLEQNLAALEGGIAARVFASGMAAINAICAMFKSGDHVVCGHDLYGGVPRLFNQVLTGYGMEFTYVNTTDPKNVENGHPRTHPHGLCGNPNQSLNDGHRYSSHQPDLRATRKSSWWWTTLSCRPIFSSPSRWAPTWWFTPPPKFLNGHSDGLGGVVVCTRPEQVEQLSFVQKAAGAILSPFECWLVLRGVKTLAVRMEQHDRSGQNGRGVSGHGTRK